MLYCYAWNIDSFGVIINKLCLFWIGHTALSGINGWGR